MRFIVSTTGLTTPSRSAINSAKQESLRKKLLRRNAAVDRAGLCDICDNQCPALLEAARVFDVANRKDFEEEFAKLPNATKRLPISVNDAGNGLLLCANCHAYFDMPVKRGFKRRNIEIINDGTIILRGHAKKDIRYSHLNGIKVPWHKHIGSDPTFPTAELLRLGLRYTVSARKRLAELFDPETAEDPSETETPVIKKARR